MLSAARFFSARELDCPVVDYDWTWARDNAGAIAAHFAAKKREKPALFDGRIFLCRNPSFENGAYRAEYFETGFSAFLAWRDFGFPDREVFNGFAMPALRSADGAFLLGEMGAHTSTAGQSYFPAGTPDLSDVREGRVDLAGSIARELKEETGLDIAQAEVGGWTMVALGPRIACLRAVRFARPARALLEEVGAFLAREAEPELARLHAVFPGDDPGALNAPDFIKAFLARAFGEPARAE